MVVFVASAARSLTEMRPHFDPLDWLLIGATIAALSLLVAFACSVAFR